MARILVIDDEEFVRMTVSQMLESDGHSVTEANDGKEGLASLRETPMDLVITDILMPNKEGLETIMEIRKKYPALKIIAMSGGGRMHNTSFLETADVLGADAVLKKPFETQDLKDVVAACDVTPAGGV